MKTADLEVYVPPVIHYARDQGGDVEQFAIPLTIVNSGARTGTRDLHGARGREPASRGARPRPSATTARSSATRRSRTTRRAAPSRRSASPAARPSPIRSASIRSAIRCRSSSTMPATTSSRSTSRRPFPRIRMILDRLWRKEPEPVTFEKTLPWISDEQLGSRHLAIPMHDKDVEGVAGRRRSRKSAQWKPRPHVAIARQTCAAAVTFHMNGG